MRHSQRRNRGITLLTCAFFVLPAPVALADDDTHAETSPQPGTAATINPTGGHSESHPGKGTGTHLAVLGGTRPEADPGTEEPETGDHAATRSVLPPMPAPPPMPPAAAPPPPPAPPSPPAPPTPPRTARTTGTPHVRCRHVALPRLPRPRPLRHGGGAAGGPGTVRALLPRPGRRTRALRAATAPHRAGRQHTAGTGRAGAPPAGQGHTREAPGAPGARVPGEHRRAARRGATQATRTGHRPAGRNRPDPA